MRRLAFNVFSILSLLVFVLSGCLWVRSFFVWEAFQRYARRSDSTQQPPVVQVLSYAIYWEHGGIGIARLRIEAPGKVNTPDAWTYRRMLPMALDTSPRSPNDRVYLKLGNFRLRYVVTAHRPGWSSLQDVGVPLWVFLPAALPPVLWLRRRRRTLAPGFPITATSG